MLADYAVKVEDSRGRRYPEPQHPYRDAFQRDRDRVIHARAFRRLENKTQVFTHRYSDHFRNRLTHTIEVAQISRTIAIALGLNEELVEALALAHDIGHPPFGHSGEAALDACMRKFGKSFDHNLHALRIVEDFEQRYAAFPGLNLTFEVREGIIKHSHDYTVEKYPHLAEYVLDQRPPLEAQLIDHTDEIAYNTADLDDGYEAELLDLDEIRANVRIFDRAYREAETRYPDARRKLKFNEALKAMMNRLVTDLIENTARRLSEVDLHTVGDVRNYPERIAGFSAEVDAERGEAKKFLYRSLYHSENLRPQKADGEKIVTDVFSALMGHPEQLPGGYQQKIGTSSQERVVCDYIAGMTDNFILDLHHKLCN
ncbi:MAG TPA: deoxyguanosinetriphosphate triphosphohydrolase [Candidatus Acidoferrales bacterium]|nr:deoxyguanosinetriphosphate triphosphohydrolase [Candidatus Acidoferrales bacterium]